MVHALEEIWRVLKPGGALLDLRPLHTTRLLQIVSGDQVIALDTVDYAHRTPDDHAADAALQQVVSAGQFIHQRQTIFQYGWYWDTLAEVQAHFASRNAPVVFTEAQIARYRQQLAASGPDARLRLLVPMWICLYAKSAG